MKTASSIYESPIISVVEFSPGNSLLGLSGQDTEKFDLSSNQYTDSDFD
ncbi:MAG: hypothetical protein IJM00_06360 [Bacteroidales bacterium]|nr:hypothetical protein [Bacteroidales bacterium]